MRIGQNAGRGRGQRIPRLALLVLALISLVIALRGMSRGGERIAIDAARRDARTAQSEGTVMRFYTNVMRGGRDGPMEIVAFTTAAGDTVEIKAQRAGDRLGRKYTVRYDPADPRHNYALAKYGDTMYSHADVVLGNIPFFALAVMCGTMAWLVGRWPKGGGAAG